MGEVYRATDTRLNRDVAIKVLPASFAADADRRARFEAPDGQVMAGVFDDRSSLWRFQPEAVKK
jgi:serine/threonine protein kinase